MRHEQPDSDWYSDNVLVRAAPGGPQPLERRPSFAWLHWWREQIGDDRVVQVAAEQGFVLATGELTALGVSRSNARTNIRHGRWRSPCAGVVAPLDPGDESPWVTARRAHALHAAAAALRRRPLVVCGRSAAILHGLPTCEVPSRPELCDPAGDGLGRAGDVHRFGAALTSDEVTEWFGVRVTDVARTVVDVARHDRRDGLVAADAALHDDTVTRADLERAMTRARGWPGVRTARQMITFADERAESPLESLVRLALHDDGFPPPVLQRRIGPYRVDFCWPERNLVLEADGRLKYDANERWNEKKRETVLRRHGQSVERVLWSDLGRGWPAFSAGLRTFF